MRRLFTSMDILSQLKPCPFCGSRTILVQDLSLYCQNCGAKGPSGSSVTQALILWNVRMPKSESTSKTQVPSDDSLHKIVVED
jgi:Lar family restriction alleviation protein